MYVKLLQSFLKTFETEIYNEFISFDYSSTNMENWEFKYIGPEGDEDPDISTFSEISKQFIVEYINETFICQYWTYGINGEEANTWCAIYNSNKEEIFRLSEGDKFYHLWSNLEFKKAYSHHFIVNILDRVTCFACWVGIGNYWDM